MNKLISLSLSAALLAMPMAGCAEGALDTAMNAVDAADSIAAQFTLSSAPEALEMMGLTDDSAQMVSGMLDTYALDMVIGDNMFHARLDTEDSTLIDAAAEIDGDTVYLTTSLLDKVYCISVDELTKLVNNSTPVPTENTSLYISKETVNEIAQKLMGLNYNFDSTIAYASTLAGKVENVDGDGATGNMITLTGEEVITLLQTAANDFTATEGATDVIASYIPGVTAENLKEVIDSTISQASAAFGAYTLTGSIVTDENGALFVALAVNDDADNAMTVELTIAENEADITLYQVVDDEKTALCSLTAAWEATDDTAKTDIALTVDEQQFVLSLGAASEDNALDLSAGFTANGTQMGTAVLAVAPNAEAVESWITDKTGAVSIMTLSADEQNALCAEMEENLQNAFSGDSGEELHSRSYGRYDD